MALECEYYDNKEVMAKLGRDVVDQYIGFKEKWPDAFDGLRGPASYIINNIAGYVEETEEEEDEADEESPLVLGDELIAIAIEKCPACGYCNCICEIIEEHEL